MAYGILLIDKDREHANALGMYLERQQFDIYKACSHEELAPFLDAMTPEILIADPYLTDPPIIDLLKKIKRTSPEIQIIINVEPRYFDSVMDTLQDEAVYFLSKPIRSLALDLSLKRAAEWLELNKKLNTYKSRLTKLETAQNLYRQLFDEVPCYISVQDREFRLTATNKLFKKDFGSQIGSYCYEVYKHRTSPCRDCPVAATFEDGKLHHTEEIVTSKSGKQYNVLTLTAPIRNSEGKITQVIEMSTNITQIRQLQDHLTSLGLMIGSMSHGVKGMLTAMDGGIYQLETGLAKNDQTRIGPAFDVVKQISGRIRKMVLEILYYAKSRELKYESISIESLSGAAVDAVKAAADKNGIRFDVDIPSDLGTVEVDPSWVQATLVNFLENAVDACVYNGSDGDHYVKFSVHEKEPDSICFVVEDNGLGMDRETKNKMFTLFFTSKGSQGTGLGLFIANQVIRQHGGSIEVESEPSKGSRFLIYLPRRGPEKTGITDVPERDKTDLNYDE